MATLRAVAKPMMKWRRFHSWRAYAGQLGLAALGRRLYSLASSASDALSSPSAEMPSEGSMSSVSVPGPPVSRTRSLILDSQLSRRDVTVPMAAAEAAGGLRAVAVTVQISAGFACFRGTCTGHF